MEYEFWYRIRFLFFQSGISRHLKQTSEIVLDFDAQSRLGLNLQARYSPYEIVANVRYPPSDRRNKIIRMSKLKLRFIVDINFVIDHVNDHYAYAWIVDE